MKHVATQMLLPLAVCVAVAGCGQTSKKSADAGAKPPTSIQVIQTPPTDVLDLVTGSPAQQITATIVTFYRATWDDNKQLACSLFSPAGLAGFMKAAKVAFPIADNQASTCEEIMAYFNADLVDSADNLQQAGVNVSGNILNHVGVSHIVVNGDAATAQAPQGVEEFIKPKLFVLVHSDGRWQIQASKELGKTLPQLLAEAKAKGELTSKKK